MATELEIQQLLDKGANYRVVILTRSIELEQAIQAYAATYFISNVDKYREILEIIFEQMTFDAKIKTFKEVLKRVSGIGFEKKYDKLFSDIRQIKEVRNKFAHLSIFSEYSMQDSIPKEISLVSYGKEPKVYSKEDFKTFNTKMDKCMEVISGLELP